MIRDLKPENILFDSKKTNAGVKIIDFGASVRVDKNSGNLKRRIGTVKYYYYYNLSHSMLLQKYSMPTIMRNVIYGH